MVLTDEQKLEQLRELLGKCEDDEVAAKVRREIAVLEQAVASRPPVIYVYTRAQAISDGVLVDVTDTAKEAGFRVPVAVTRTVWERLIVPGDADRTLGQSKEGRLWDTLWMLRFHAKPSHPGDAVFFSVLYVLEKRRRLRLLKAVGGFEDNGNPALTIMLPEED